MVPQSKTVELSGLMQLEAIFTSFMFDCFLFIFAVFSFKSGYNLK